MVSKVGKTAAASGASKQKNRFQTPKYRFRKDKMRRKEIEVIRKAFLSIPKKYHRMHPKGQKRVRTLRMLMEWTKDLLPKESYRSATSSGAATDNSSDGDVTTLHAEETIADIDDDAGDNSSNDSDEIASEERRTAFEDDDAAGSEDGEEIDRPIINLEIEDTKLINSAKNSRSFGTSWNQERGRRVEKFAFDVALLVIPRKYKKVRLRALKHHRVIHMLKMWLADLGAYINHIEKDTDLLTNVNWAILGADADNIEEETNPLTKVNGAGLGADVDHIEETNLLTKVNGADLGADVDHIEEETDLFTKVDGASELQRLRIANGVFLDQLIKLSKRLDGADDEFLKAEKDEIDKAIRKGWLCMAYDSEQEMDV